MNDLLKAVVELVQEATIYLKHQNAKEKDFVKSTCCGGHRVSAEAAPAAGVPAEAVPPVPPAPEKKEAAAPAPAPKKESKPRAKKAEEKKEPAAPAPLTEEQSTKKVCEVATAYVERFQKSDPDGRTRAKKILLDDFKVGKITDLTHENRLKFMAKLEAEMAAADKAPEAAAETKVEDPLGV